MGRHSERYRSNWETQLDLLPNGQRIYYPEPEYFYQEQLGMTCCVVLKIKQRISNANLQDIMQEEFPDSKKRKAIGTDLYANRLKSDLAERTWNHSNVNLSKRITLQWPATPFEEWLEETVTCHWMTTNWFQENDPNPFSDYAFMTRVNVPIMGDLAAWKEEYSEVFTMTKMIHG